MMGIAILILAIIISIIVLILVEKWRSKNNEIRRAQNYAKNIELREESFKQKINEEVSSLITEIQNSLQCFKEELDIWLEEKPRKSQIYIREPILDKLARINNFISLFFEHILYTIRKDRKDVFNEISSLKSEIKNIVDTLENQLIPANNNKGTSPPDAQERYLILKDHIIDRLHKTLGSFDPNKKIENRSLIVELKECNKCIKFFFEKIINIIKEKDKVYLNIKDDLKKGLSSLSAVVSDLDLLDYDLASEYLLIKSHPAPLKAEEIKNLKLKVKKEKEAWKLMEYYYDTLFTLFPDLNIFLEDLTSIQQLQKSTLQNLEEDVDRTRYYLTKEEWEQMPEVERNQKALDRYISSRKTSWQIGRDYEMFVGYEYQKEGWFVNYHGIEKQLEDLGRDLIAKKDGKTLIIQCKYWAQYKEIHENVISQLYGTAIQYKLSERDTNEIIPVLITNIDISEKAKEFSDYLKIKVIKKDMRSFPRIKCNINPSTGEKIYHLPMDQQYERAQIKNKGEFMAFTVQEAIKAGFRRAWRYHGIQED